jgi:hypothetical protein
MIACQSASDRDSNPPGLVSTPPALLTRMSSPPQSAASRLITVSTPAAVPMSAGMNRTPSTACAGADRAVATTRAPASWKRRTTAAPMPRVPPVTSTRLSANSSADVGNG